MIHSPRCRLHHFGGLTVCAERLSHLAADSGEPSQQDVAFASGGFGFNRVKAGQAAGEERMAEATGAAVNARCVERPAPPRH